MRSAELASNSRTHLFPGALSLSDYKITDEALGYILEALELDRFYSGNIETVLFRGGLREPQLKLTKSPPLNVQYPGVWTKEKAKMYLACLLPSSDFSGRLQFKINSGKLSGKPTIISK